MPRGLSPSMDYRGTPFEMRESGLLLEQFLGENHPQAEQGCEGDSGGDDFHGDSPVVDLMFPIVRGSCYALFSILLTSCYIVLRSNASPDGVGNTRFIHGKGTGAPRRAIRAWLDCHPLAFPWEGGEGPGGTGAATVGLK